MKKSIPAATITTKKGFTDKEVWDFLLSKNIDITPLGNGVTKAKVPKRLLAKLETMAHVKQVIPDPI